MCIRDRVTARYQIDSHVYEYLRYSCGFTSEEINRNKEVNWWKNNSFTPEAIKADGYLEQLREKK